MPISKEKNPTKLDNIELSGRIKAMEHLERGFDVMEHVLDDPMCIKMGILKEDLPKMRARLAILKDQKNGVVNNGKTQVNLDNSKPGEASANFSNGVVKFNRDDLGNDVLEFYAFKVVFQPDGKIFYLFSADNDNEIRNLIVYEHQAQETVTQALAGMVLEMEGSLVKLRSMTNISTRTTEFKHNVTIKEGYYKGDWNRNYEVKQMGFRHKGKRYTLFAPKATHYERVESSKI